MQYGELSYFKLAKYFFPFDKEIVVAEATALVRNKVFNEYTHKALEDAMRYDPYSIELLGIYVQFENSYGNKNKARILFNRMKKIGSNTNSFKELQRLDTMKGF